MSVLTASNITMVYGGKGEASSTQALNGIELSVERGDFVGVMGPSGSGKTTLLQILSGIAKPTTGRIEIAGSSVTGMNKHEMALFRRRKLGFVFQEFNLLDSLSLKENIMLPMILDGKETAVMEAKAQELMSLFGIDSAADKYPYHVSGGQQQRAAVCRALVNDPALVFADEPTGNLDSKSSKAVMSCFERMNREKGSTILMVTHDPFAASFCKRIIFIKDGRINMEIVSTGDRKAFFDRILDCQAILGGERYDV